MVLYKLGVVLILTGFLFTPVHAQKIITISGFVKDAFNGESLAGTLISIDSANKSSGNTYGFYSVSIPTGKHHIQYAYIGYQTLELNGVFTKDTIINAKLSALENKIDEVEISISGWNNSNRSVHVTPLSMSSVKLLPPLLGEADLIRSFQLLPGVSTIGDGASGFNVRGGGVDQNLVLLDEAPLYFTSHLFNLFSVANPDAVLDAVLYKTEMPARFGGRLSSVLDTRLKEGNNQKWSVAGGLGLIASRLTIEGPIKKDKSSVLISARRSYTDVITRQSSNTDISDNSVYFYDLSTKMNLSLSNHDRLFVSGYLGKDKIQSAEVFMLQWGNGTATVRWNHVYTNKLFSNVSAIYSNYQYSLGSMSEPTSSFEWKAGIIDYTLKTTYNWYPNVGNTVYFGAEAALHEFSPGNARPAGEASIFSAININGQRAAEYNLFWDQEIKVSDYLSMEYGLRLSAFQSLAKDSTTVSDYEGGLTDRKTSFNTRQFTDWESMKWYVNLQPRLSLKLQMNTNSAIKASYSRTVQYLHLMTNTISTSPLDMWAPSSYNIEPEKADQVSAGYFSNLFDGKYEASAEVYYRKLYNQLDFVDGAETLLNKDLPGDILVGNGRAYGSEFYFKKKEGRFNGWISYTLSKTERKINGINNNAYYPAKYDKTHSLAAVAIYEIKPRISVSATYSFSTGTPATLPSSKYEFAGYSVQYNAGNYRNNYRIPAYHRLDLSATFKNKTKPGKKISGEWVVSAFNALNRRNAFSMYLRQNEDNALNLEAVRFSMIGMIIPSVTYNFKF